MVLDQHLNFIVNETEKYSSWLTESAKPAKDTSISEQASVRAGESDIEFEPSASSSDDEETIAQEEKLDSGDAISKEEREKNEIEALQRESMMPLEDLLDELPPGYLESLGKAETADSSEIKVHSVIICLSYPVTDSVHSCFHQTELSDEEFELNSDDSEEDDEETIDQAEKEEEESRDHELQELEAEKDMPLEMLMAKYSGSPSQPMDEVEEESEKAEAAESEGTRRNVCLLLCLS